jgi:hypothetical protein
MQGLTWQPNFSTTRRSDEMFENEDEFQETNVLVLPRPLFLVIVHLLEQYGKQYNVDEHTMQIIADFLAARDEKIALDMVRDETLKLMNVLDALYSELKDVRKAVLEEDYINARFRLETVLGEIKDIMASEGFFPENERS